MVSILAFHAHPDDVETLCAGTLAVLGGAGASIVIATATAGECGSRETEPETTARIRLGEAATAASMIGARHVCAGLPDLGVFNDDAARRAVTEIVRSARPDIVIGPSPVDYHPDHEATALLVRDACFAASAPNYRTGPAEPLEAIPHLYFTDPIEGRDREGQRVTPDFGVDITPALATKLAMIRAHRSQVAWLEAQHGVTDFEASIAAWSRRRGRDFGVEAAEGFRQYRSTPYPRSPKLQDLLGAALLQR